MVTRQQFGFVCSLLSSKQNYWKHKHQRKQNTLNLTQAFPWIPLELADRRTSFLFSRGRLRGHIPCCVSRLCHNAPCRKVFHRALAILGFSLELLAQRANTNKYIIRRKAEPLWSKKEPNISWSKHNTLFCKLFSWIVTEIGLKVLGFVDACEYLIG